MAHPDTPEAVDAPATLSMADAAAAFDDFDDTSDGVEANSPEPDDLDLEEGEGGEGEELTDEADEPETAITPPASLNADEKAAFAQLPEEAQRLIADVEARRNTQVQEATTRAAERERQAAQAAQHAEVTAQRNYAAQLEQIGNNLAPEEPQRNWFPDDLSYLTACRAFDQQLAQHNQFMQHVAAIRAESTEAAEQIDMQARIGDLLTVEKLADPATRDEYMKTSLGLVQELGLDPVAFEQVAGSEDFKALEKIAEWKAKAERFEAAMSRKMSKVRSAKGKSLRPGAAQRDSSGAERRSSQAMQAYRNNPSSRAAAAAVFEDI